MPAGAGNLHWIDAISKALRTHDPQGFATFAPKEYDWEAEVIADEIAAIGEPGRPTQERLLQTIHRVFQWRFGTDGAGVASRYLPIARDIAAHLKELKDHV